MEIMRNGRPIQRIELYHPTESVIATIAAGESISTEINTQGLVAGSISVPDNYTGTQMTFLVSSDKGASYQGLKDGKGNEYGITVNSSNCFLLDPAVFTQFRFIKIRSGLSATPVNQTSACSLIINLG